MFHVILHVYNINYIEALYFYATFFCLTQNKLTRNGMFLQLQLQTDNLVILYNSYSR